MSGDHDHGSSDVRAQLISVAIGVVARFLFSFASKGVEIAVQAFRKKHPDPPSPVPVPVKEPTVDDPKDGY